MLRNLRLRTLVTLLDRKVITSSIPADFCARLNHWLGPGQRSGVYLCTDASYTPLSPATDSSDTAADTPATFSAVPPAVFIPVRKAHRKTKSRCYWKQTVWIGSSFSFYPPLELHFFLPQPGIVKQQHISEDREDTGRAGWAQRWPWREGKKLPKLPWRTKSPGKMGGIDCVVELREGFIAQWVPIYSLGPAAGWRLRLHTGWAQCVTDACPGTSLVMGSCRRCQEKLPKPCKGREVPMTQ